MTHFLVWLVWINVGPWPPLAVGGSLRCLTWLDWPTSSLRTHCALYEPIASTPPKKAARFHVCTSVVRYGAACACKQALVFLYTCTS